jgi:hypothetical protein
MSKGRWGAGVVEYEVYYNQNPLAMLSDEYSINDAFVLVGSGLAPIHEASLRQIFSLFNDEAAPHINPTNPQSRLNRSMSVGDLIVLIYVGNTVKTYRVQHQGFRLVPNRDNRKADTSDH